MDVGQIRAAHQGRVDASQRLAFLLTQARPREAFGDAVELTARDQYLGRRLALCSLEARK
jgi:hypothetical protein